MNTSFALCFFTYLLISLIVCSIVKTAIQLLQPWSKSALDLPAEEYLLLPLASHRTLFASPNVGQVVTSRSRAGARGSGGLSSVVSGWSS